MAVPGVDAPLVIDADGVDAPGAGVATGEGAGVAALVIPRARGTIAVMCDSGPNLSSSVVVISSFSKNETEDDEMMNEHLNLNT